MHKCDQHRSIRELHASDELRSTLNEERIKDLIHFEYQFYFKRKQPINIYANQVFKWDLFNDLKSKVKLEFDA